MSFHNAFRKRVILISAVFGTAGAISCQADPILGGEIYANGGLVTVTFDGSDAGYDNLLFLATTSSGTIFEGHVTAVGTTTALGTFAAGTELVFGLDNQQGNIWYTGPASANSDGVAHAMVDGSTPGSVYVGFEDLLGGGDRDYNDLEFTVNNASVPDDTATLSLLGLSLVGLVFFSRRLGKHPIQIQS